MGGYIFFIGSQPSILFCDMISFRIRNLIGEIAIIGYPSLHGNYGWASGYDPDVGR